MFNDVKKSAFEQFKIAVNQNSIEKMADDIYIYQRPSPYLERLEKLAEIFHEYGNPASMEAYKTLRNHSLQYRDIDKFMALAHSQYNWFDSVSFHHEINQRDSRPALRAVK